MHPCLGGLAATGTAQKDAAGLSGLEDVCDGPGGGSVLKKSCRLRAACGGFLMGGLGAGFLAYVDLAKGWRVAVGPGVWVGGGGLAGGGQVGAQSRVGRWPGLLPGGEPHLLPVAPGGIPGAKGLPRRATVGLVGGSRRLS